MLHERNDMQGERSVQWSATLISTLCHQATMTEVICGLAQVLVLMPPELKSPQKLLLFVWM